MAYILTYNNRPITRTRGAYNFIKYGPDDVWVPVTFSGGSSVQYGSYVWRGYNSLAEDPIYYNSIYQLTSYQTWSNKSWTGLTSFDSGVVWRSTDNRIFYSNGSSGQYELNGSNWSSMTWGNVAKPERSHIWTDGRYDYYGDTHYRSSTSWYTKTWTWADGKPSYFADNAQTAIWRDTDGTVYYSYGSNQYVLNGSTWSKKTWTGVTSFEGKYVWHDLSGRTFLSHDNKQYELNSSTSTWSAKTWGGVTPLFGVYIWNDGYNVYYTYNYNTYKLT